MGSILKSIPQRKICLLIKLNVILVLFSMNAYAVGNSLITVGAGIGGILDDKQEGYNFIEYRLPHQFHQLTPWITVEGTRKVFYIGAGLLLDIHLCDRLICTPSFGAGYYDAHNGIDLGYSLEFRSSFEISYHFGNRSRIGVAIGHYSNASFGDKNPGIEALKIIYSIPF